MKKGIIFYHAYHAYPIYRVKTWIHYMKDLIGGICMISMIEFDNKDKLLIG